MPLNVSGSLVNASTSAPLDTDGVIKRGLVFHVDADSLDSYPGNDTTYDISTNSHNVTMYNGGCINFDGSNDTITVGALDDPPRYAGTIMCWVKTDYIGQSPITGTLLDSQGGWFRLDRVASTINMTAGNPAVGHNQGSISTSAWSFVCGTYDTRESNGALRVYVNGASAGNPGTSVYKPIEGNNFTICPNNYDGKMTDMRVYKVALSADEIREIYTTPSTLLPGDVKAEELVGWWPMNEGWGDYAYSGIGQIHGVLTNGPAWVTGGEVSVPQTSGRGCSTKMDFDGTNDYLLFGTPNLPTGNTNVTLSCWVWPTTSEDSGCFGYGSAVADTTFEIYMYNDSGTLKPAVHYAGGNSGYNLGLTLKRWNHIAATYDKTSVRTYVNGKLSVTDAQALTIATTYRHIGAHNYGSAAGFFDGQIDECAAWNTVLSIEDIKELAERHPVHTNVPNPPDARNIKGKNLVAYWRNTGPGNWKDLSGSGNDAVVNGSPNRYHFPRGFSEKRDSQGFPMDASRFNFDGSNSYGQITSHSDLDPASGDMSWESWFKCYNPTGDDYVYGNYESGNDRVEMRIGTAGKLCRLLLHTSSTQVYNDTNAAVIAGEWYHLVALYDRSAANVNAGITFYVNGVYDGGTIPDAAWDQNGTINPGGTYDRIGSRGNNGDFFNGEIAILRIYNRLLSGEECIHNFKTQRDRFGV